MNKNILIGIVIVLVAVGGFMVVKQNGSSEKQDKMMMKKGADSTDDSALGEISGSLKDLFAKGVAMQCTFEHIAHGGTTTGKLYISGNNMRGDFELVQPDGNSVTSNMIREGDTNYVWSSELEQGFKTVVPEATFEAAETLEDAAAQSDPFAQLQDENVSYNCQPWIVDRSMFTPPTDIEFVDFSAQIEKMQNAQDSVKDAQCAACDQVPVGEGRDQCLQALGC